MDIVYRLGAVTVADVVAQLPDPPSESAVRAALWLLEEKGHLSHSQNGPRNVYSPTLPAEQARRSAVRHLLGTFFRGSRAQAVAAILEDADAKLSDSEVDEIERMLARARKARSGRKP